MGILNVTPDSFSGDGLYRRVEDVTTRAHEMVQAGADILDIGGESTRPGYVPVDLEEELARVIPAVEAVRRVCDTPISVDTSKPEVASRAVTAGASVINDVTGRFSRQMAQIALESSSRMILVHNRRVPSQDDLVTALLSDLDEQIRIVQDVGVRPEQIIVDPGLGMSKGWRENFTILRRLGELRVLGRPILVGPSRKGMIGRLLGVAVDDRLEGTAALVTVAIAQGADIVRVHDAREMTRVARMTDALVRETSLPAAR